MGEHYPGKKRANANLLWLHRKFARMRGVRGVLIVQPRQCGKANPLSLWIKIISELKYEYIDYKGLSKARATRTAKRVWKEYLESKGTSTLKMRLDFKDRSHEFVKRDSGE